MFLQWPSPGLSPPVLFPFEVVLDFVHTWRRFVNTIQGSQMQQFSLDLPLGSAFYAILLLSLLLEWHLIHQRAWPPSFDIICR